MNEIDMNKVTASVVADLAKDFINILFETIPNKFKEKYKRYFEQFQFSLKRDHTACSFVRTIINKESSVPLDQIYVKTSYQSEDNVFDDDDLCQNIRDGQRTVVLGFGGIGKTIFCKYLWNAIFKNPQGKIPVFFELRNLNDLTTQDLVSFLRHSLVEPGEGLSSDVFIEMLRDGRFIFILDGFDEIPEQNRKKIERQILDIASEYPNCGLVVSSRYDDRFYSWGEFIICRAKNFEKAQSREVIEKAKFNNEDIKKEFIKEIIEKRYEQYEEFFATPLLTLMMLMTYSQIRYIPEKSTIFYKYAFQTLYTLHDASKQAFQRKRYVDLSESDFIHVFSLFCLVSYIDGEHSFDSIDLTRRLEEVKQRVKFDYDSEKFLKECVESVNLLYKEGTTYNFTHRSFQEYFCAYAATHYFPEQFKELMLSIPISDFDSVFEMICELNTDIFEKLYVLPEYKTHQQILTDFIKLKTPWDILHAVEASFTFFYSEGRRHWLYRSKGFEQNSKFESFSSRILNAYKAHFFEDSESGTYHFEYFYHELDEFFESMRKSLDYKFKNENDYLVIMDFSTMKIMLYPREEGFLHRENDKNNGVSFELRENQELINNHEYTSSLSKLLQSRASFVEKTCKELQRHDTEVKAAGNSVLSL